MIYQSKQEITLLLNQRTLVDKDKQPIRLKINKLTEYVVIMDKEINGKTLIFNRESGESIPKSNLTIVPDSRCKACFSWDMSPNRVKFRRIDKYERRRITRYGHVCEACGYLNTEN